MMLIKNILSSQLCAIENILRSVKLFYIFTLLIVNLAHLVRIEGKRNIHLGAGARVSFYALHVCSACRFNQNLYYC